MHSALALFVAFTASLGARGDMAPVALSRKASQLPVYAYITGDGSPGEQCTGGCLQNIASKVAHRRGVKSAKVLANEIQLEVVTGAFKAEEAIRGIDGMRVEMRVPYKGIEIHFVESALFPPIARVQDDMLLIELGEDVRKAIEAGIKYRPVDRMKCIGQLSGMQQNEALLNRFETEKRPPASMIPFMAEADLDGDRRPDLYLRIEGLPEFVIFNRKDGLKAIPLQQQERIDEIPRCDQNPARFARPTPRSKVKCLNDRVPDAAGDAVERVAYNRSNQYVMWGKKGGYTYCEPLGEGAMPPKEKKEDEEQ